MADEFTASTEAVLSDVAAERRRQERLRDEGKFVRMELTPLQRLPILLEEVGEVAKALVELGLTDEPATRPEDVVMDELREELIQVAACAVAWVEELDARWAEGVNAGSS